MKLDDGAVSETYRALTDGGPVDMEYNIQIRVFKYTDEIADKIHMSLKCYLPFIMYPLPPEPPPE